MRSLATLATLGFGLILPLLVPSASAKCCQPDAGGDCGDNSGGTPCCGYKKCNGFCCACQGVNIIREEIDTIWSGTHYLWTSVITAPWSPESGWTTWTCRASHVTSWDLPPHTTTQSDAKRGLPFNSRPTVTTHPSELHHKSRSAHSHGPSETMSSPTLSNQHPRTFTTHPAHLNNARQLAELAELADAKSFFKLVSNSVAAGGEDVITLAGYLDYFNITGSTCETAYGRSVVEKFHWQDRNGDGMLTFAESQLRCDAEGCV
ncbi:uncharacterized protein A1O9_06768 [Exophiala aquamarina CBS 119918]|uniref:EF-hand domain-containing protein n=1 Tax=Exophiala aquamarina CBS 119918 TaxID=1182545 RepID=A0A072P8X8_9EURO|nr:uncharacterized protein A1O9_06768 [Exophiala aquamarina CBS 119918]KEF56579.1 hypothetical protein A1O9_06768 [Exophiala aquamarina CBS 119918]